MTHPGKNPKSTLLPTLLYIAGASLLLIGVVSFVFAPNIFSAALIVAGIGIFVFIPLKRK